MKPMVLFSSQRLNFHKLTDQYIEEFCAMDMDAEVMEFYTSRPHGTREDALKSYARYMEYQSKHPELGGFMVFDKLTNDFVGLGVLIHLELNPENGKHEVGYRLPKNKWGQGYATEICKRLIRYGFEDLNYNEIFGTTHPQHFVSQKVLLKCGLHKVGSSTNYGGSTIFKIDR